MICDIAGAGGVLHVDARVEVPDIEHVPVLRASQGGIDVETVQDALGLNAIRPKWQRTISRAMRSMGYDVGYQLIWYDNGSLDINESGKFKAYLYEPGRIYDVAEIVENTRSSVYWRAMCKLYSWMKARQMLLRPMYEQLPVSNTFAL